MISPLSLSSYPDLAYFFAVSPAIILSISTSWEHLVSLCISSPHHYHLAKEVDFLSKQIFNELYFRVLGSKVDEPIIFYPRIVSNAPDHQFYDRIQSFLLWLFQQGLPHEIQKDAFVWGRVDDGLDDDLPFRALQVANEIRYLRNLIMEDIDRKLTGSSWELSLKQRAINLITALERNYVSEQFSRFTRPADSPRLVLRLKAPCEAPHPVVPDDISILRIKIPPEPADVVALETKMLIEAEGWLDPGAIGGVGKKRKRDEVGVVIAGRPAAKRAPPEIGRR